MTDYIVEATKYVGDIIELLYTFNCVDQRYYYTSLILSHAL